MGGETYGLTPYRPGLSGWVGLGYSAVYIEAFRDRVISPYLGAIQFKLPTFPAPDEIERRKKQYYDFLWGVVIHEIGHGPTEGNDDDHDEGGIMAAGGVGINADFSASSIKRFR